MSIDIADRGRGVFYLNFRTSGELDQNIRAESTREFNFGSLVEKSGDYAIAIERLIVPAREADKDIIAIMDRQLRMEMQHPLAQTEPVIEERINAILNPVSNNFIEIKEKDK